MPFSPFYALNAVLIFWVVRDGIYSPRFNAGDGVRGVTLALLVWFDACLILWLDTRPLVVVAYCALIFAVAALSVPDKSAIVVTRLLGRARFALYILSMITVTGLVYVHLPIATFLTSPEEIGIQVSYLTTNNVHTAMAIVYLAALVYALVVSPRMKSALTLLALTTAVLALIYSYVLPLGYPIMSGVMFEQIPISVTELVARSFGDAVLAVVAGVIVLKALIRFGGVRVAVAMTIMNVSLLLASGISVAWDTDYGQAQEAGSSRSLEKPFRYSKHKPNVLIIFLDRFMGGFVEDILEHEPELMARLDGFTWYPRTLSAGVNSIAGAHPVFGGYDYTPREMNRRNSLLRDLSVEAYRILPHNFSQRGYRVNVVNPRGLGFTMAGDCSHLNMKGVHCTHVASAVTMRMAEKFDMPMNVLADSNYLTESSYADLLVLLGTMRAAPYLMKDALRERGPWQPFMDHSAETTFREWAELKSLPDMSATDSPSSNLNIMWSILPHEPYFMGEDCLPRRTLLNPSDDEVRSQGYTSRFAFQHAVTARCSLLIVADYLDWLKGERVYDNTKIIIVSDHGIIGSVEDRSSRAIAGDTTKNIYVQSRSVLLVKDAGQSGALVVSEEFMPNAEVPRIACEQIGGCVNPFLGNKPIEALGQDEPFYVDFVPWQFNAQKPKAFVIETEMSLVNRDPYDATGWRNVPKE